jgi:hypothetical protein
LAGAALTATTVSIETMRDLPPPGTPSTGGYFGSGRGKTLPRSSSPPTEMTLVGYQGGNLQPSSYGASAAYGLGEVHVLSFDPQQAPGVDSPWVHVRIVDMLRRANERVSGVLFRPGAPHTVVSDVRRQLDPNEGSRWAVVLSALLLCLYALLAGPVNFTYWAKKHHPLRALLWLPILSGATFGIVAVIGIAAKGCSGRARHLTLIEAGAGMTVGSARRWRGFFVPSAREMTIYAGNASSIVAMEQVSHGDQVRDILIADKNGMRVSELAMRPWETVVVREDGPAQLGDGITLAKISDDETMVVNRTGRRLRGVILSQPHHGSLFVGELEDGASMSSKLFAVESRASTHPKPMVGALTLTELNPYGIARELDKASPGLTDAWAAIADALGGSRDWFPADVPVLLAQIEGGEGIDSDAGLTVDSDRLLVRIVGYGGKP